MKKTISQLRQGLPDRITIGSWKQIRYILDDVIDFDVYLESKQFNLQRPLVWTLMQKQELIWSILMGRPIPNISAINLFDNTWQIIDGKQRLSTILQFYTNKFPINIDGCDYTYKTIKEYDEEYHQVLTRFGINFDYVFETKVGEFSDEFKINWFKFINFAGTPQDAEHMEKLLSK